MVHFLLRKIFLKVDVIYLFVYHTCKRKLLRKRFDSYDQIHQSTSKTTKKPMALRYATSAMRINNWDY